MVRTRERSQVWIYTPPTLVNKNKIYESYDDRGFVGRVGRFGITSNQWRKRENRNRKRLLSMLKNKHTSFRGV